MIAPCAAPGCARSAVARGLCQAHYAQQRRGRPISPLRGRHGQRDDEPMQRLPGLRVSARAAEAARRWPAEIRAAIEAWARTR